MSASLATSDVSAAAPKTTATTEADLASIQGSASDIVQAIRVQAAAGGGSADITLQPNFLGDVTVSVKVDHGEVTARLEASTPVVREWLDANQGWLRDRLADQNLTLSRLDIAAPASEARPSSDRRDAGGEQQTPGNSDPQSQSRRQHTSDSDETFELLA